MADKTFLTHEFHEFVLFTLQDNFCFQCAIATVFNKALDLTARLSSLTKIEQHDTGSIKHDIQLLMFSCLVYRRFELDPILCQQLIQYCNVTALYDDSELQSLCISIDGSLRRHGYIHFSDQQIVCMVIVLCKCCGAQWASQPNAELLMEVVLSDVIHDMLLRADVLDEIMNDILNVFLIPLPASTSTGTCADLAGAPSAAAATPEGCSVLSRSLWVTLTRRVVQFLAQCCGRSRPGDPVKSPLMTDAPCLEQDRTVKRAVSWVLRLVRCKWSGPVSSSAEQEDKATHLMSGCVLTLVHVASAYLPVCAACCSVNGASGGIRVDSGDLSPWGSCNGVTVGAVEVVPTLLRCISVVDVVCAILADVLAWGSESESRGDDSRFRLQEHQARAGTRHTDALEDKSSNWDDSGDDISGGAHKSVERYDTAYGVLRTAIVKCDVLWSDLVSPLLRILPALLPVAASVSAAERARSGSEQRSQGQGDVLASPCVRESAEYVRERLLGASMRLFVSLSQCCPLHCFHQTRCTLPVVRALIRGCQGRTVATRAGYTGNTEMIENCQHVVQNLLAFNSKFDAEVLSSVQAGVCALRQRFVSACGQASSEIIAMEMGMGASTGSNITANPSMLRWGSINVIQLGSITQAMRAHMALLHSLLAKIVSPPGPVPATAPRSNYCSSGNIHRKRMRGDVSFSQSDCGNDKRTRPRQDCVSASVAVSTRPPPATTDGTNSSSCGGRRGRAAGATATLSSYNRLWVGKLWIACKGVLVWMQALWTCLVDEVEVEEEGSDLWLRNAIQGTIQGSVTDVLCLLILLLNTALAHTRRVDTLKTSHTHTRAHVLSQVHVHGQALDREWRDMLLDVASSTSVFVQLLVTLTPVAACRENDSGRRDCCSAWVDCRPPIMPALVVRLVLLCNEAATAVLWPRSPLTVVPCAGTGTGTGAGVTHGDIIGQPGSSSEGSETSTTSRGQREHILAGAMKQLLSVGAPHLSSFYRHAVRTLLLAEGRLNSLADCYITPLAARVSLMYREALSVPPWQVMSNLMEAVLGSTGSSCECESGCGAKETTAYSHPRRDEGGGAGTACDRGACVWRDKNVGVAVGGRGAEAEDRLQSVTHWMHSLIDFISRVDIPDKERTRGDIRGGKQAEMLSAVAWQWLLSYSCSTKTIRNKSTRRNEDTALKAIIQTMPRLRLEVGVFVISCLHWPTLWENLCMCCLTAPPLQSQGLHWSMDTPFSRTDPRPSSSTNESAIVIRREDEAIDSQEYDNDSDNDGDIGLFFLSAQVGLGMANLAPISLGFPNGTDQVVGIDNDNSNHAAEVACVDDGSDVGKLLWARLSVACHEVASSCVDDPLRLIASLPLPAATTTVSPVYASKEAPTREGNARAVGRQCSQAWVHSDWPASKCFNCPDHEVDIYADGEGEGTGDGADMAAAAGVVVRLLLLYDHYKAINSTGGHIREGGNVGGDAWVQALSPASSVSVQALRLYICRHCCMYTPQLALVLLRTCDRILQHQIVGFAVGGGEDRIVVATRTLHRVIQASLLATGSEFTCYLYPSETDCCQHHTESSCSSSAVLVSIAEEVPVTAGKVGMIEGNDVLDSTNVSETRRLGHWRDARKRVIRRLLPLLQSLCITLWTGRTHALRSDATGNYETAEQVANTLTAAARLLVHILCAVVGECEVTSDRDKTSSDWDNDDGDVLGDCGRWNGTRVAPDGSMSQAQRILSCLRYASLSLHAITGTVLEHSLRSGDPYCGDPGSDSGSSGGRAGVCGLHVALGEAVLVVSEVYARMLPKSLLRAQSEEGGDITVSPSSVSPHFPAIDICQCLLLLARHEHRQASISVSSNSGAYLLWHALLCSAGAAGLRSPLDAEAALSDELGLSVISGSNSARSSNGGMSGYNGEEVAENEVMLSFRRDRNAVAAVVWQQSCYPCPPCHLPNLSLGRVCPLLRVDCVSECQSTASRLAALLSTLFPLSSSPSEPAVVWPNASCQLSSLLSYLACVRCCVSLTVSSSSATPTQSPGGGEGPARLPYMVLRRLVEVLVDIAWDVDQSIPVARLRLARSLEKHHYRQCRCPWRQPTTDAVDHDRYLEDDLLAASPLVAWRGVCLRLAATCLRIALSSCPFTATSASTFSNAHAMTMKKGRAATGMQAPRRCGSACSEQTSGTSTIWKCMHVVLEPALSHHLQEEDKQGGEPRISSVWTGTDSGKYWNTELSASADMMWKDLLGMSECKLLVSVIRAHAMVSLRGS